MPTCKQIKRAYEKYCNRQRIDWNDPMLRKALQVFDDAPSPSSVEYCRARVAIIADWGGFFPTRLKDKDRRKFAHSISKNWAYLTAIPDSIAKWINEPKQMDDVIRELKHRIPLPGGNQLSFASKYLHWCVSPLFPIWDTNAKEALKFHGGKTSWESYKKWTRKIRDEILHHRKDPDCSCQLHRPRKGQSIIRTLDKALWIMGRPKRKR